MIRFVGVMLVLGWFGFQAASAQTINSPLGSYSEHFDGFTGAGFTTSPGAGQLDSDFWRTTGFVSNVGFGGSATSGEMARGDTNGGAVSTQGIYGLLTPESAMWIQPGGADFTPGTITLRILNDSGSTITNWNISSTLMYLNDQARSNSLTFSYSTDDSSYTQIGSTVTSPVAADALGVQSFVRSVSNVSASVADGSYLFLQWEGDDVVAAASARDEFGIDDISVQAVPEVEQVAALVVLLLGLLVFRRRTISAQ